MTIEDKIKEIEQKQNFQCDWFEEALQEMAEWENEQEIEFLQSLMFQASTPKALNIIINNRIKLLKGK